MLNNFKIKDKANTEKHFNCKEDSKIKHILPTWPWDKRNGIMRIGTHQQRLQGINIQISLKGKCLNTNCNHCNCPHGNTFLASAEKAFRSLCSYDKLRPGYTSIT